MKNRKPFEVGESLLTVKIPVEGVIPQLVEGEIVEVVEGEYKPFPSSAPQVKVKRPNGRLVSGNANRFRRVEVIEDAETT